MRARYKYGLITGVIVGVFTISFFSLFNKLNSNFNWNISPGTIRGVSGLLTVLILAIGIYLSINRVKKTQNGILLYVTAVKAGVTVAIITALITALFSFIYCDFINPGYAAYMIGEAKKTMIANGESPDIISEHLAAVKMEFSTSAQVLMVLISQSVIGTIISLIMALFIKSKKI